jgi:hypothetical protein
MRKRSIDTDRIAKGLGAKKRGRVYSTGGFTGAAQLAAEVRERFRVPDGGGRPTDPSWSDKRLVPLSPRTLDRLQRIAAQLQEKTGVRVEPMQLAAILLETTADQIEAEDLERLAHREIRRARREGESQ